MSIANREQVRQYLLRLLYQADRDFAVKTAESFAVSKSTVYNYTKQLCKEGLIQRAEGKNPPYEPVIREYRFHYNNDGSLGEDRVFQRDIAPLLPDLNKNVFSAWRYAFTEMMNNAIEHSCAEEITVCVRRDALNTTVMLSDNGIGIFRNIQGYLQRERGQELLLEECAALLFAGKFTTARQLHSGEGIFFTSHLMDSFGIFSDGVLFSRDNFGDATDPTGSASRGTLVVMSLGNDSKKNTKEVFDRFADVEDGFIRTHIPIAHVFPGGYPVSRSEARRLGALIEGFKEIDLDFSHVEEVGQAFVHELFIVWQSRNPHSTLKVSHAEEAVRFMIKRVKNTN